MQPVRGRSIPGRNCESSTRTSRGSHRRLGCHDRELIVLLLEHSPAEAGRMLGIPRSTVHDKILRLRRRFVEAGFVPNGGCQ